jgi:hypothetical protein
VIEHAIVTCPSTTARSSNRTPHIRPFESVRHSLFHSDFCARDTTLPQHAVDVIRQWLNLRVRRHLQPASPSAPASPSVPPPSSPFGGSRSPSSSLSVHVSPSVGVIHEDLSFANICVKDGREAFIIDFTHARLCSHPRAQAAEIEELHKLLKIEPSPITGKRKTTDVSVAKLRRSTRLKDQVQDAEVAKRRKVEAGPLPVKAPAKKKVVVKKAAPRKATTPKVATRKATATKSTTAITITKKSPAKKAPAMNSPVPARRSSRLVAKQEGPDRLSDLEP